MNTTIMGIASTLSLIATIWVIYDVWANNKGLTTGVKVIWTIVAFLFGIIGAAAYYFLGRNKTVAEREDSLV